MLLAAHRPVSYTHLDVYKRQDRFIDLQVILSHVKDIIADEDPRITILRQVREQGTKHELGNIGFSIAVKGFTIIL